MRYPLKWCLDNIGYGSSINLDAAATMLMNKTTKLEKKKLRRRGGEERLFSAPNRGTLICVPWLSGEAAACRRCSYSWRGGAGATTTTNVTAASTHIIIRKKWRGKSLQHLQMKLPQLSHWGKCDQGFISRLQRLLAHPQRPEESDGRGNESGVKKKKRNKADCDYAPKGMHKLNEGEP